MTKPNRSNEIDAIVGKELKHWRGVEFTAADIATPTGEMTRQVFNSLARLERAGRVKRLTAGASSKWMYSGWNTPQKKRLDARPPQHQMR